ncbi:DUF1801 domain-containing protein [Paenibacillus rhizoplanae]
MNPEVTDYIAQIKLPWQSEICSKLREIIHGAIPEVAERIQYGKPHFLKKREICRCPLYRQRLGELLHLQRSSAGSA